MKRNISHLTPTYIKNRIGVIIDERRAPHHPWLTKQAVEFLGQALRYSDRGLEYGSGRSSVWFAGKISHLISVEDNREWHAKVRTLIREQGLDAKIDYRFCATVEEYVAQADTVRDESLDFCLVDGSVRDQCVMPLLPKLKHGALLVVDNINWYLPSTSATPASRSMSDGYGSDLWAVFGESVADWRRYWTTNGVTDTCIWFKP